MYQFFWRDYREALEANEIKNNNAKLLRQTRNQNERGDLTVQMDHIKVENIDAWNTAKNEDFVAKN